MLGTHDLLLFVVAGLLLSITPGADTLYIVGRSASQGFRAGAIAASGIATGCCVHILAAALGLSALLYASAAAFTVMKIAGAIYLVWIGIALLRDSGRDVAAARTFAADSSGKIFLQGFVTNVLNPKVAIFFLAFLPQFIDRGTPNTAVAMLFLGLIFNLNGTLWNLAVAYGSARISRNIAGASLFARLSKRAAGGLFLFLGYKLATSEH